MKVKTVGGKMAKKKSVSVLCNFRTRFHQRLPTFLATIRYTVCCTLSYTWKWDIVRKFRSLKNTRTDLGAAN